MGAKASRQQGQGEARVFLSYSRGDEAFMRRLAHALEECGYTPIFDQSKAQHNDPDLSLAAQNEWWEQLKTMIAAADVMVFVVTPASAQSRACNDEIAHARNLGKRVIAVRRHPIELAVAPERLRALNVRIDFCSDEQAAFDQALGSLVEELAVDIDWHRRTLRLVRAANQWDIDNRPDAQLLRVDAVNEAEALFARRPAGAPETGPLVRAFLDASREYESAHRDQRRRSVGRAFVNPVEQAAAAGLGDRALRLAAAGVVLADDPNFSLVPELWRSVADSAFNARIVAASYGAGPGTQSPDGSTAAATCEDGTIIVHSFDGDDLPVRLSGDGSPITSIAIAPDNAHVLAASKAVRVWSVRAGAVVATMDHDFAVGIISILAISPDGTLAVTTAVDPRPDVPAFLWHISTGELLAVLRGHSDLITAAAFDASGRLIVTTSQDKTARLWQADNGHCLATLRGHSHIVTSALFFPDATRVLTTSIDKTTRIWNSKTGEQTACLQGHEGWVRSAAIDHDGKRIVTASSDKTARVWDAASGKLWAQLRGHDAGVSSVAFSGDGARIVTGSADRTARVWDAVSGVEILRLSCAYAVKEVQFSQDGTRVQTISQTSQTTKSDDGTRVTGSGGTQVQCWDAAVARPFGVMSGHEATVNCLSFSPDGKWLVTGSEDGTARIWDVTRGITSAVLRGHGERLQAVAFSPDGSRVVTASGRYSQSKENSARVWDASSGAELAALEGHDKWLRCASFSPDGGRVLTTSGDGTARVWDVVTGLQLALLATEDEHCPLGAFASDGSRIVVVTKRGLVFWDACTFAPLQSVQDISRAPIAVISPNGIEEWLAGDDAYSFKLIRNDGRTLADDVSGLLDARTGATIVKLGPRRSPAAISPSGLQMATAAPDGDVSLWDVSRTSSLSLGPGTVLCGAISCGVGTLIPEEAGEMLMADAPNDLFASLSALVGKHEGVRLAAASIRTRLHPNCYLSPTQLKPPRISASPVAEGVGAARLSRGFRLDLVLWALVALCLVLASTYFGVFSPSR